MPISLAVLLAALRSVLRSRAELQLENLALRQQINVLRRSLKKRPKLSSGDRLFWVSLSRLWRDWPSTLVIVKPETVVAWHRKGFRLFWTWKVRRGQPGRLGIPCEIRDLIHRICRERVHRPKLQGPAKQTPFQAPPPKCLHAHPNYSPTCAPTLAFSPGPLPPHSPNTLPNLDHGPRHGQVSGEEYKKLYEATRTRAQEPKKKGFNWKPNNCTTLSCSPSIPDCGPTRHGAWSSGMSRWLTTKIWARRSWRLKYGESAASDIARVCRVR